MGAEASKISVVLWEKIEPSKAMGKFISHCFFPPQIV